MSKIYGFEPIWPLSVGYYLESSEVLVVMPSPPLELSWEGCVCVCVYIYIYTQLHVAEPS
jgi:hypothetical protein